MELILHTLINCLYTIGGGWSKLPKGAIILITLGEVVAYRVLSNVLYSTTSAVLILGRPPPNWVWRMSMIPDSHVR